MKPEGPLSCSKEAAICIYPEPDQSSPRTPKQLSKDLFQHYITIYVQVFQIVSYHQASKTLYAHLLYPTHATCPTHFILLDKSPQQ